MKLNTPIPINGPEAELLSAYTPVLRRFVMGQVTLEIIPDLNSKFAARVFDMKKGELTYIARDTSLDKALSACLSHVAD